MNLSRSVQRRIPFLLLAAASLAARAPTLSAQTGAPVGRWVSLGPTKITNGPSEVAGGDVTGRLSAIALQPGNPDTILVGARGAGVWRTSDGGLHWTPVTDSLGTQTVAALAFAPSQPTRAYLATPDAGYRSDDSGTTWVEAWRKPLYPALGDGGTLRVDRFDANRLYLTACAKGVSPQEQGIRRSLDGGLTWTIPLPGGCATSLTLDPADPNRLLAAFEPTPGLRTGLWESADGGETWFARPGCPSAALPDLSGATRLRVAQAGTVRLASVQTGASYRIYRATGATCGTGTARDYVWQLAWTAPGDPLEFWSALEVDPADPNQVFATGTHLWVSHDGGSRFTQVSPEPHRDHHAFAADPLHPGTYYFGTDGGLFRTTDTARTAAGWSFVGTGIVNAELYDVADSPSVPQLLLAGTQDNGAIEPTGSGGIWQWRAGGDAELVDIDPADANTRYVVGQQLSDLSVTHNAFATPPLLMSDGLPATGCLPWDNDSPAKPLSRFAVHPTQPTTLLASCGSLWIGWPFLSLFTPPSGRIVALTVDPTIPLYWAGTSDGQLFAGVAGLSWSEVFRNPVGALAFSDLELDPFDPTVLYASFSGRSSSRIFRLQRSVTAPYSVTAINLTPPSAAVIQAIAVDRLRPSTIYIGTNLGVYRATSTDNWLSWTWTLYADGMPAGVDVRDLELHPVTGVLRAATFGRGAWEVQTATPIGETAAVEGRLTQLRVHEVGGGYGPPEDLLDGEVVVQLDSQPGYAYGFQLRDDAQGPDHKAMLDLLRDAFRKDRHVRLDYVRTGFRNGLIRAAHGL